MNMTKLSFKWAALDMIEKIHIPPKLNGYQNKESLRWDHYCLPTHDPLREAI